MNKAFWFLLRSKGFFIFSLLLNGLIAEAQIKGKVINAKTKEPLAFVTIGTNHLTLGTISDIDGRFELHSPKSIKTLIFNYIGFETLKLDSTRFYNKDFITVEMMPTEHQLAEVKINLKYNPALEIIKKAQRNRELHNPENLNSFSYSSYNKFIYTMQIPTDSLGNAAPDDKELKQFFDKSNLLLIETVTERKFKKGKSKEKIIASRVSGLQEPALTLIATQFQSFSFYNDVVTILEKNYVTPLAPGSLNHYDYIMEDSIFNATDTTFVIAFSPKRGKNFDALKGVLYINSSGYAVQNVIAEPVTTGITAAKIQQQYERVGTVWFPQQLNLDMSFSTLAGAQYLVIASGRTYLKDIQINIPIDDKIFDETEVEEASPAEMKKDESFWQQHRPDTLSVKEQATYTVIDSLGKKIHLDKQIKIMTALISLKYPVGKYLYLDVDKLLNSNKYENIRIGLGFHTSERVSRALSIGAYVAYGFKDKGVKYGGDIAAFLSKKNTITYNYANDIREAGEIKFNEPKISFSGNYFHKTLVERMDKINLNQATYNTLSIPYFDINFFINNYKNDPAYDYIFVRNDSSTSDEFTFSETGLKLRFSYKEKFMKSAGQKVSLGTPFPILYLNFTKGLPDFLGGEYEYYKTEVKLKKSFFFKYVGTAAFTFAAGKVFGQTPYPVLYAGMGSYAKFSVMSDDDFHTMRPHEFLSDRFATLKLYHNFGKVLIKNKYFQPDILVAGAAAFGDLENPEDHQLVPFKVMDKGYYEAGLILDDLYRKSVFKFGIGAFYRLGEYSFDDPSENISVKLSMKANL